jgi:hypothetical protein
MHEPNIVLSWPAILIAVVAAFFLGFLWYGPLFGKPWAKLMGFKLNHKPKPRVMAKAYGLQLLGTFLTAFVMAHTCQIWRPSVWGLGQDSPFYMYGFYNGIFTWLGFYVPLQFGKVTWENRPWKLFFINASYELVMLQAMSLILAYWR